jgi:hypothetical protein
VVAGKAMPIIRFNSFNSAFAIDITSLFAELSVLRLYNLPVFE